MNYCEDSPKKKKRKKVDTSSKLECLVHVCNNEQGSVSKFTERSWNTALQAAKRRRDETLTKFIATPDIAKYGYHRSCYSTYTNVKTLSKFPKLPEEEKQTNSRDLDKRGVLAPDECFICRSKKYSGSTLEELTVCQTTASAEQLNQFSETSDDNYVKAQVSTLTSVKDFMAREFKYHRSCYRTLTRPVKEKANNEVLTEEVQLIFGKVKTYVNEVVIEMGQIIRMKDILDHVRTDDVNYNVTMDTRRVKSYIIKTFGAAVSFMQKQIGTPDFVYATDPPKEKNKTPNYMLMTETEKVSAIASLIRKDITDFNIENNLYSSWPPLEHEVSSERIKIPPLLSTLLNRLITKENSSSKRVCRLVKSIGQDIMYASSRGKIKTIKHVQLGIVTKRKTGSKLIVNCLNRLGHCINYDEINYLETSFANHQAFYNNNRAFVPNNVQPSTFVTFVYDNCDHNPETLNGATMHFTNGIIIQKSLGDIDFGIINNENQNQLIERLPNRRRSFKAITNELQPYIAPKEKSNPPLVTRFDVQENLIEQITSKKSDILWMLMKHAASQLKENRSKLLPSWTGHYYEVIKANNDNIHKVFYLPPINKSPTKLETIQEILLQVKEKSERLSLQSTDLVLDHAIYSKALEVMSNPRLYHLNDLINLRMGPFHACGILIAVISKRFAAAGLKDILIESNLVGPSSIDSLLKGKQYNKAVRAFKKVYEAMFRMKLEVFKEWLHSKNNSELLTEFLESAGHSNFTVNRNVETYEMCSEQFEPLFLLWEQFDNEITQNLFGPMACFWQSFIDMVQILLDFIKSTRLGDWSLHQDSALRMLPWFHAYDRVNYSRHFTYYWATQCQLHEKHPEIYNVFQQGGFSTKRTAGNFNCLPPDQVIEQTINKEQKGPGGIIGFSTTEGSIQRWVLSSHVFAKISTDFKASLGLDCSENLPKDLQESRKIYDEECVTNCYRTIAQWCNPFNHSESIVSCASGKQADEETERDLLKAREIGATRLESFLNDRVFSHDVSFNDRIATAKLRNFDTSFKNKIKLKNGMVAIKSDRQTFARLIVVQQQRNVDLREVLNYELSALPLALSNNDGTLNKTTKSKLQQILDPYVPRVSEVPEHTVSIFDAMVLLQKLPPTLKTFADISTYLLKKVTSGSSRISFFVTDNYIPLSIKSMERRRRMNSDIVKFKILRRDQDKPKQFEKCLRDSGNKLEIIRFLLEDWSTHLGFTSILEGKEVYLTVENKSYRISCHRETLKKNAVLELETQQEEADTKMFLCCLFAEKIGFQSVKIVTVDTDIMVLALYYQSHLNIDIYLEIGTSSKTKIYDIKSNSLPIQVAKTLPSFHAITGCDSTSSFCGMGKNKAFKVLQSDDRFLDAMNLFGESENSTATVENVLEEYVCKLYGYPNEDNINNVRYNIFIGGKKLPDPSRLPPTSDALKFHLKRAAYQTFEWKQALNSEFIIPDPNGKGWKIVNGNLEINWMSNLPAPEAILEFVSCNCKKNGCLNNMCRCNSVGLKCTSVCNCQNCQNTDTTESDSECSDSDEDTDNESDSDDDSDTE